MKNVVTADLREFPVGVVYSLATGLVFAAFDKVHGAIEYVLGSPVWTHHLAMTSVWDAVKEHVAAQYPALLAIELSPRPQREDDAACRAWCDRQVASMEALVGRKALPVAPLPEGAWNPLHPLDGIPEHSTPILVEVDPAAGPEGIRRAAGEIIRILKEPKEPEP